MARPPSRPPPRRRSPRAPRPPPGQPPDPLTLHRLDQMVERAKHHQRQLTRTAQVLAWLETATFGIPNWSKLLLGLVVLLVTCFAMLKP